MKIGGNTLPTVILLFILLKDGDEGVICEVTISKLAIFSVMEKNLLNEPFSHFADNQILELQFPSQGMFYVFYIDYFIIL